MTAPTAPRSAELVEGVPVLRWRVTGPLAGWRDDDPDALMRCSIDPEHVIQNGDHYAISGIKVACILCSKLPPQKPVEERAPKPKPAPKVWQPKPPKAVEPTEERTCSRAPVCVRTFTVAVRSKMRQCGARCRGLVVWETRVAERKAHAVIPTTAVRAVDPPTEPIAPVPPSRFALGPAHRDYGKPVSAPSPKAPSTGRPPVELERRTCARDGCQETFEVRPSSTKRHHAHRCAGLVGGRPLKAPEAPIPVVAPSNCRLCGAAFTPTGRLPNHCSWACEIKQAGMPQPCGPECPCLRCATERAASREATA